MVLGSDLWLSGRLANAVMDGTLVASRPRGSGYPDAADVAHSRAFRPSCDLWGGIFFVH